MAEVLTHREKTVNVAVEGHTIGATKDHPFFVKGKGWTAADSLRQGYHLLSSDKRWVVVQSVVAAGEAPVHNLRVESQTFFVGGKEWGFSALVSAACTKKFASPALTITDTRNRELMLRFAYGRK